MTLFRPEVIEAKRRRLWGEVRLSQPPSLTLWSAVLGATALVVMIGLVFGTYVKKETVSGYLAPEGGIVQLSASRAGRITRILAREGDHVRADAALLELSGETVGVQTGQVSAAQLAQIDQQLASASGRRDATAANLESDGQRLRNQLASQIKRRDLLMRRLADTRQLVQISEGQLQRFVELARDGYVSQIQLTERRQQMLAQRGDLNVLESDLESVIAGVAELRSQIADQPSKRAALLAGADLEISTLTQRRIEVSANQRFVERAPVSGTISSLQAEIGQVPVTNAPLISIMPDDAELLAELLVPTRAAGFMKPGDEVRLQIEAYPFERFGFVMGQVTSLSRSILRPGEYLAPIEFKEAVYRVRVRLSRDFVLAYGKEERLRPGMVLRADVVIDRKPLWRQFMDPMLAAIKRAH